MKQYIGGKKKIQTAGFRFKCQTCHGESTCNGHCGLPRVNQGFIGTKGCTCRICGPHYNDKCWKGT